MVHARCTSTLILRRLMMVHHGLHTIRWSSTLSVGWWWGHRPTHATIPHLGWWLSRHYSWRERWCIHHMGHVWWILRVMHSVVGIGWTMWMIVATSSWWCHHWLLLGRHARGESVWRRIAVADYSSTSSSSRWRCYCTTLRRWDRWSIIQTAAKPAITAKSLNHQVLYQAGKMPNLNSSGSL